MTRPDTMLQDGNHLTLLTGHPLVELTGPRLKSKEGM